MGGHGGLNILPQKRWNVYNYDNREKVRRDEEAAAKEEQLKREQARKRDAEFRIEKLRQARGLASSSSSSTQSAAAAVAADATEPAEPELQLESKLKSNHINLFEGIKIFDPIRTGGGAEGDEENKGANKRMKMMKMMKKEAAPPRVVTAEDEKYRLGYGIAGKGVKLPWYMSRPVGDNSDQNSDDSDGADRGKIKMEGVKSNGKKSLQELREERLKREKREKERERALLSGKGRKKGSGRWERDWTVPEDRYFSRR